MKRQLEMDSQPIDDLTSPSDEKRRKANPSSPILNDDCLGCILNYLPIEDLIDCRVVSKNWKEVMESERVESFGPIKKMIDFCSDSWKEERNDELFVSLSKWLNGKTHSIRLANECPEYFQDTPNPLIVSKFPSLTMISSSNGWVSCVEYSEIICHVEESVKIRMHIHISTDEDELVYVNVEPGYNPSFNWKPFNIDPTAKNILVHQVNGNSEDNYQVDGFQHNTKFFNQIGKLFDWKKTNPSCYIALYRLLSNGRRDTYEEKEETEQDEEYSQAVEYKYSDDLREILIQKPLEKIKNEEIIPDILEILQHIVCNANSACLNRINLDDDLIVNEIDVIGEGYVNRFREYIHAIETEFKLTYQDKVFNCKLDVLQHLYYGCDGYEGEHSFEIEDSEDSYSISGRAYGTDEAVVWDEMDIKNELVRMGLDSQFETVESFIETIIDSVVDKLPIIDAFYCTSVSSSNSLKSFLKGRM